MKARMHLLLWLAAILTCMMCLSCHTIQGMGRDIEEAGQWIQDAVD